MVVNSMGSGSKHIRGQSCSQQEEKDTEITKKIKHKKRTKKIQSQLKDQIEFYFSDSNLQKDRFLKQAISKHPEGYVGVKTIADFNRMKQLTDDFILVIKAIKSSSLLQLNEDESMVKRKTPIPEARNVDAETVYVEKLPSHADHDWLKKVFSQFGKVNYVSLPRFKNTGEIKGFAFVEFETPNEADTAVQTFTREKEEKENGQNEEQIKPKRRKRSQSESDVDDKQSNKTEKTERKRRRTISESSADSRDSLSRSETLEIKICKDLSGSRGEIEATSDKNEGLEEVKGTRKRKRGDKAVHWEHEGKRIKNEAACEEEGEDETEEGRSNKKSRSSESESNAENTEEEQTDKKKKHKKRKRKTKEKKESKLPALKVISKLEWLRLKEEYKQLQRQSMQELKKQLQECHERESEHSKEEILHRSGKNKTTRKETANDTEKSSPVELPFTPGVVLRFKSADSEIQRKDIRDKFATHGPVAYIDLADGTGEGYVRFHTPDNCTAVLNDLSGDSSSGLELVKLAGQEERDYWIKINANRVARFQAKREKKRGTEKVARKADAVQAHQQVTHIRFDDE